MYTLKIMTKSTHFLAKICFTGNHGGVHFVIFRRSGTLETFCGVIRRARGARGAIHPAASDVNCLAQPQEKCEALVLTLFRVTCLRSVIIHQIDISLINFCKVYIISSLVCLKLNLCDIRFLRGPMNLRL